MKAKNKERPDSSFILHPSSFGLLQIVLCFEVLFTFGCLENKSRVGETHPTDKTPEVAIQVAAAADLRFALDDVARDFRKKNPGIEVAITYGSSGNFYTQLSNHAPFDLYLSADIDYPRKLVQEGLAVKDSEFVYGVGRIVVWVPNSSGLNLQTLGIRAVTDPSVKKVAIANPKHAPYGRAAEAALKTFGIYRDTADRLVLGENIAQTAQFVESGSADVGIIALSLALSPNLRDKGRYWVVPLDSYPRLEQGGVIPNWARNMEAVQALRSFLIGEDGRAILRQYGFMLPGE